MQEQNTTSDAQQPSASSTQTSSTAPPKQEDRYAEAKINEKYLKRKIDHISTTPSETSTEASSNPSNTATEPTQPSSSATHADKKSQRGQNKERHKQNRLGTKRQKTETVGQQDSNIEKNVTVEQKTTDAEEERSKPLQTDQLNKINGETMKAVRKGNYGESLAMGKKVMDLFSKSGKDDNKLEHSIRQHVMDVVDKKEMRKKVDFKGKLILAPLTTVGNLPYRRICKEFGVDITVGEMAIARNILQGNKKEMSLFRRHKSEDIFGVQLAVGSVDDACKISQVIETQFAEGIDFVDINCGCPIDLICNRSMGSSLLGKQTRLQQIVLSMKSILNIPLTVKTRTGLKKDALVAHQLYPKLEWCAPDAFTLHGRTKEQRYSKLADWEYIKQCKQVVKIPLIGNGDIYNFEEYNQIKDSVDGVMIGRGALIKPWLFQEIKEQKIFDISSTERFDMLRKYAVYGIDHWGSDAAGVNMTRRFMLEWMSFLHRYVPVAILEKVHKINERVPAFYGRNELETKMASTNVKDWIELTEMIPELGKAPEGFTFIPKHKANAYGDSSSTQNSTSAVVNSSVLEEDDAEG